MQIAQAGVPPPQNAKTAHVGDPACATQVMTEGEGLYESVCTCDDQSDFEVQPSRNRDTVGIARES